MRFLIAALVSLCTLSTLAADKPKLGSELKIAVRENGQPAFCAQYTYGDDPDGKNYLLTLTPDVAPLEKSKKLLWNFYIENTGFLFQWNQQRVTSLATIQIYIRDTSAIENILKNQRTNKDKNPVYFVLADPGSLQPIYFLPISKMCTNFPTHFKDLTNGNNCDKISNP